MKSKTIIEYPEFKPLLALVFFGYVSAFFLQIGSRIDIFGAIRLEFLLAATLLLLSILYDPKTKYPPSKLSGLLTAYILLVVIQVPLSVDVSFSWNVFLERFLKFSVMAFFIARFVNSPKMIMVFLAAFLLSCFKMGQEGLLGNITGSLVWQNQGIMRLHGSTGMYAHPNSFAGMALGTLPFLYYLYPISGKYLKIFFLIMLVFAINIIVFSGSRTGYVGFFAIAAIVFWNSQKKARYGSIALFCVVAGSFYMPDQYVERFESIFTGEEQEGASSDARIQILSDSFEVFIRHPFGVGVSAFPLVREEYFGMKQDTHNLYLEIATNLGFQGLIAFGLLYTAFVRRFNSIRHSLGAQLYSMSKLTSDRFGEGEMKLHAKHEKDLNLFLAMVNAILVYLLLRLVLGLFGHDLYEIYWWIVIGFVFSLNKLNTIAEKRTAYFSTKAVCS